MDSSPSATTAAGPAAAAEEEEDEDEALAGWPTDPSGAPLFLRRNPSPVSATTPAPSGVVPSSWLEIRLFYVRVWPCAADAAPEELTLSHPRREMGVALEVNGSRAPPHEVTALPLRRDRLDRAAAEATYVCTDNVRVAGPAIEFEIQCASGLVLCGSLARLEGGGGADRDAKTGWTMDCYPAPAGAATFARQKVGASPPSVEVYVAGCCSGFPLILTRTLQLGPKKKVGGLDSIPEDEEGSEGERKLENGLVRRRPPPMQQDEDAESDDCDTDVKIGQNYYPEGAYYDEDGQLSWFNAGVRVGVGIGLGMCIGVGLGVGILMRSYQVTRNTFRRRFF